LPGSKEPLAFADINIGSLAPQDQSNFVGTYRMPLQNALNDPNASIYVQVKLKFTQFEEDKEKNKGDIDRGNAELQ